MTLSILENATGRLLSLVKATSAGQAGVAAVNIPTALRLASAVAFLLFWPPAVTAGSAAAGDNPSESAVQVERRFADGQALSATAETDSTGSPDAAAPAKRSPEYKYGGYVVGRYLHADGQYGGFDIAYARLKVLGRLNHRLRFFVQVDLTNDDVFKDGYADIAVCQRLTLRAGQFKYRFGVYELPWDFRTISKPRMSSALFGDPRDIGISALVKSGQIGAEFALVNGTARSEPEDDHRRSLIGTVFWAPVDGLQIGLSGYDGTRAVTILDDDSEPVTVAGARRDRWGGHLWYEKGRFLLQAEYVCGIDRNIRRAGWYIIGGFHFLPEYEAVCRIEYYDPNTSLESDELYVCACGINGYAVKSAVVRCVVELERPGETKDRWSGILQGGFLF